MMRHLLLKPVSIVLVAFILGGCSGQQLDFLSVFQMDQIQSAYHTADKLIAKDQVLDAAELLWNTSFQLPSPQQQEMQIHASVVLLNHQFSLDAYSYLNQIDEDSLELEPSLLLRKRIAEARFYENSAQYERIIQILPHALVSQNRTELRIEALQLLVRAQAESGYLVESIATELELGTVAGTAYRAKHLLALWGLAQSVDPQTAQTALEKDGLDKNMQAWLELALIATPREVDPVQLSTDLANWEHTYSKWQLPESVKTDMQARWVYLDFSPQQVSVLLPLTGAYAKYGKAIQAGLNFAQDNLEQAYFKMQFYNTDYSDNDMQKIYQQSLDDGAELIIGPLLKKNVDALHSMATTEIPVLTLNYTQQPAYRHSGELFQFGLLPEDEAVQIAQRLIQQEHYFVVVFQPDSPWGDRLNGTFTEKYTQLGGVVRETVRYEKNIHDFSTVIENNFGLSDSYQRRRALANAIGYTPDFKPRVRDDIQAIVLFADEKYARLIYPQMKYHYLDKLPVYASSHVYNPKSSMRNRDLDGLIYCDAPIVIAAAQNRLEKTLNKPGAEKFDSAQLRLFALGVDAYHLTQQLRKLNITRADYPGMTGTLIMHPRKRLFRKLSWAQFQKDQPRILH